MMIDTQQTDTVRVVSLVGDLDSASAPEVQRSLGALVEPGGRLLLDLSGVPYMSSAGLRAMLLTYRQSESVSCRIGLVGLSAELRRTMTATGFLNFFTLCESVAAGVRYLQDLVPDSA